MYNELFTYQHSLVDFYPTCFSAYKSIHDYYQLYRGIQMTDHKYISVSFQFDEQDDHLVVFVAQYIQVLVSECGWVSVCVCAVHRK